MIKALSNLSQIVTLQKAHQKDGRRLLPEDLSIIECGSVVFDEQEILWVGETKDLSKEYQGVESTSLENRILLPEIVDSHTHLVFGGNRAFEYAMRLNGATYEELAQKGGGILCTMKGTNELAYEQLLELAMARVTDIASYGVGTIEIKSGYGLNYDKEKELTQIIDQLKKIFSPKIQIINTFMAAHAVPKNYASSREYLSKVVTPLLREVAPMVDCCDIFHEDGYFNKDDVGALLEVSKELNIPFRSHADEFNNNQGATLAVQNNFLSVDHLLKTDELGIKNLANSKTVATLLPGTGLFLGKPQAQARKFLDKGVKVAMASDYNPGSCHCDNIILIASIVAAKYEMNMAELFSSITLNAAHALGLYDQGAIVKGLKPRFSIFNTNDISNITYNWGKNLSCPY